jgi:hypothetical protein
MLSEVQSGRAYMRTANMHILKVVLSQLCNILLVLTFNAWNQLEVDHRDLQEALGVVMVHGLMVVSHSTEGDFFSCVVQLGDNCIFLDLEAWISDLVWDTEDLSTCCSGGTGVIVSLDFI